MMNFEIRFCVPNFHSLQRNEMIEGIFIGWRHERLSSTRVKILRADEKLRRGDRRAVVGSVKFTAKHLFDCKCAIVRRTSKKPRVGKWRKNASSERKLKITNRKKIQKRFLQFAIKTVQVADSDSSVSGNFLVLIFYSVKFVDFPSGKFPKSESNVLRIESDWKSQTKSFGAIFSFLSEFCDNFLRTSASCLLIESCCKVELKVETWSQSLNRSQCHVFHWKKVEDNSKRKSMTH